jgi:hypothetical protein
MSYEDNSIGTAQSAEAIPRTSSLKSRNRQCVLLVTTHLKTVPLGTHPSASVEISLIRKCNHYGVPFKNGVLSIGLDATNGFKASDSPSNNLGSALSSTPLEFKECAGAG